MRTLRWLFVQAGADRRVVGGRWVENTQGEDRRVLGQEEVGVEVGLAQKGIMMWG